MLSRIKLAAKILLKMRRGRDIRVLPDDIFVVSYPRSGNTWTRFLVGNLISDGEPITFANIERKVLDIYKHTDLHLLKAPKPRILKSHEYFDPRYKRVIYIVRDPRDVAVSYYYYHIKMHKINENYPIDNYVSNFIRGLLNPYGSWADNVGSWIGAREYDHAFLLVKYEDLLKNSHKELNKIISFLNLNVDENRISRVIRLSSFDRMRRLEQVESNIWKPIKNSRKDMFFVRSANAGGWKSELPDYCATRIVAAWHELMSRLGYKL